MAGVGGTMGPLQMGILAILILMTLTGLYYTGTGETIPSSVMFGFAVCILGVVLGVFQSFGGFSQVKEEDPEKEAENLFEKKKEKRDQKRSKKEAAKAQEEAELELEKTAKKAAKLQAQKMAKLEAKQEADAKRLEEEKKRHDEEEKKVKKAKKPKKVKKEKETKEIATEVVEKEETKVSDEPDEWVVQPSQKEIREAKKANKDEPVHDVEMLVNSKHYPALIGEGGAVRTKIEEVCSVKLTFPRRNSGDEKIKLEGTASAITLAKQIINEFIDKGYSSSLDANATDIKISVAASCIGLLLANKAAFKKILQAKSGVRIEIPEKEEKPDKIKAPKEKGKKGKEVKEAEESPVEKQEKTPVPPVEVTLVGDSNGIARAIEAIRQLEKEGYSDLTHENLTKTVVAFPGSLVGTLMRDKGQQLQAIQKATGARIQIPPLEKENKPSLIEITLIGKPAEVEAARREIVAISTDFVTHEVDIPQSLVFRVFADKGAWKKNLQTKTNTRIDVVPHLWDPTLKTISISGADKAIQEVVKAISDLAATNKIIKMEFPANRLPALIGKAGANLQQIQNETGAHIDCDDHEWDSTVKIVTVVGADDAIEKATKSLAEVLRPKEKIKKGAKDMNAEVDAASTP
jgi:hypothetical protein